ncbi:MAG: hypothetical protein QOC64_1163, partial [Solirubrobacteraceae bacterium]|nr:hypothetical protein [Solirubrobacteraceae bacterium]
MGQWCRAGALRLGLRRGAIAGAPAPGAQPGERR